jgi:NifU-like protein
LIKGKTLEEAEKVTNKDIAAFLGGLPKEKMHCSVLGEQALAAAIANYRGQPIPKMEEGEIVCECFGVTDKEIERVIRQNNLKTREEVTNYTKAGGGCESCHDKIEAILNRILKEEKKPIEIPAVSKPAPLTNIQKMKLIEETLEREIKPALKADGGDIDLIDIEGNKVLVALRGTCSSCRAAEVTLKQYVETKFQEFVSPEITVEEVKI